ncbi:MAG: SPW repeat protein [Firmicutes bacterium]|nr:SPW repeat protein [Bacillota bacterium]MCL5039543.1 SPW repeat protein [Bacillota bacterium]
MWQHWVNLILGIWLIIAPFVLGYGKSAGAWNDVLVGIVVAIVAYWGTTVRNRSFSA